MTFRNPDRGDSSHSASERQDSVNGPDEDIDVLVVEDNPGDVRLLEEAFSDPRHEILCLMTGSGALDLLGRIRRGDVGRPTLVVLDVDLPRVDGFEILERIKSTDGLRSIPVVVLSGSTSEEDIDRAYALGANAYLSKPMDVVEHLSTLEALSEFWLSYAHVQR
jgi:CheY-like chemotaxis protein